MDIAAVTRGYREPSRNEMRYDGSRALGISLSMEKGGNIVDLGKVVDKELDQLKARMPVGIDFHKVFFQPDQVSHSIRVFMVNLIESVLIVIVVLMLTMGYTARTINKSLTYSPVVSGDRKIGKKARIAINVAPSKGQAGFDCDCRTDADDGIKKRNDYRYGVGYYRAGLVCGDGTHDTPGCHTILRTDALSLSGRGPHAAVSASRQVSSSATTTPPEQ